MKTPLPLPQQARLDAFVETARELARTVLAGIEQQSAEAGQLVRDELERGSELAVVLSLQPELALRLLLVKGDGEGMAIGFVAVDECRAGAVIQ